jgi:hypothetical protein
MVLNSTNIHKNEQSPSTLTEITEHKKDHDIWRWKSRSWIGTDRHKHVAELNRLMGSHSSSPTPNNVWISQPIYIVVL